VRATAFRVTNLSSWHGSSRTSWPDREERTVEVDSDDAVKRIEALGGSVLMAPFDVPMGRTAVVADDQGSAFNLPTHA
jgi:hypothetical protein